MRTVVIIQARMGSTRLPGKVLKTLGDKTVLHHVINRVHAGDPDEIVVATSDLAQDDAIEQEALASGAKVFRGSEADVLSRYYSAAKENTAELVVRVTSDCPLYDGTLLRDMLNYYSSEDYLSNTIERRFPRGLDTEIFTFAVLERMFNEAKQPPEREHVTPYIYNNPDKFKIRHYKQQPNLADMRWTLDTDEDWQMIKAVYDALYVPGKIFSTVDVVEFLRENPEIAALNAHIEQKKV